MSPGRPWCRTGRSRSWGPEAQPGSRSAGLGRHCREWDAGGARRETAMSREQNSALVRRYFEECVNRVNGPDRNRALAIVDELLVADFTMYYNSDTEPAATPGPEGHKEFLVGHAESLPDDHWTIEALVADGSTVACVWHFRSSHAETGNRVDVRAADFFTVRD